MWSTFQVITFLLVQWNPFWGQAWANFTAAQLFHPSTKRKRSRWIDLIGLSRLTQNWITWERKLIVHAHWGKLPAVSPFKPIVIYDFSSVFCPASVVVSRSPFTALDRAFFPDQEDTETMKKSHSSGNIRAPPQCEKYLSDSSAGFWEVSMAT